MTKYKYFKSVNYRSNVNLVVESDIVEVSDQTSDGGATPTLQEVTDEGAVTTNPISIPLLKLYDSVNDVYLNLFANDGGIVLTDASDNILLQKDGASLILGDGTNSFSLGGNFTGSKGFSLPNESGIIDITAIHKTANFTAINFVRYTTTATLTVTDPTPIEGQGYIVFVRNGTTTIGGVGYTSGSLVYRFYEGGVWSSNAFENISNKATNLTSPDDVKYPTTQAVAEALAEKENISTATTGSEILFVTPQIYNSPSSPSTANITNDLTGARIGVIQKIYHNHSVAPTVPGGWVLIGGSYVISELNIIYAEWVSGSRVEYWIIQES